MEIPQPITARPVPCDLAREHCEQIFNDYREASHLGYVELMMMAYRKGQSIGAAAAFDAVRGLLPKSKPADDDLRKYEEVLPRSRWVSEANGYEGGEL